MRADLRGRRCRSSACRAAGRRSDRRGAPPALRARPPAFTRVPGALARGARRPAAPRRSPSAIGRRATASPPSAETAHVFRRTGRVLRLERLACLLSLLGHSLEPHPARAARTSDAPPPPPRRLGSLVALAAVPLVWLPGGRAVISRTRPSGRPCARAPPRCLRKLSLRARDICATAVLTVRVKISLCGRECRAAAKPPPKRLRPLMLRNRARCAHTHQVEEHAAPSRRRRAT